MLDVYADVYTDSQAPDAGMDAYQPDTAMDSDGTLVDSAPSDVSLGDILADDSAIDVALIDAIDLDVPAPIACALPIARDLTIPSDTATLDATAVIPGSPIAASCSVAPTNAVTIFRLQVAARIGVQIRTVTMGIGTTPPAATISIRTDCADPTTERACNGNYGTNVSTGSIVHPALLRIALDPGTYYVVIESGHGGTLTLTTFDPAPNATCASALTVGDGTVLPNQDSARGGQPPSSCGFDADHYVGLTSIYYAATIPPGLVFSATIADTGTRTLSAADLWQGCCGSPGCMPGFGLPTCGTYPSRVFALVNETTVPEALSLVLTGGVFDLHTWLGPPPVNTTAATALSVTDGATLPRQYALSNPINTSCRSRISPYDLYRALYYVAMIPPGQSLTVTARPSDDIVWTPLVSLESSGPGAGVCLAGGTGNDSATQSLANSGAAPLTVFVTVGGYTANAMGPFDLTTMIR